MKPPSPSPKKVGPASSLSRERDARVRVILPTPAKASPAKPKEPAAPKSLPSQTEAEYHDLQRLMAKAVMRPLTSRDTMQKTWSDGRPTRRVAESFIKPNDRLTSFERLEIYNRQFWFRVRASFYEDYPGLRAVLGDQKFERLADAYLTHYPSQSYTLRNLGSRLVKFLAAQSPRLLPCKQLALDLARLEWAHIEAFDNQTRPSLELDTLLGLEPAKITFQLQPHLTLLRLRHEVDDFLIEFKSGSGLRQEASNAIEQHRNRIKRHLARVLQPRVNYLAVHRHQNTVYYKRLDVVQYRLLTALESGATLEAAGGKLAGLKLPANLGQSIQEWFQTWARLGWFCE